LSSFQLTSLSSDASAAAGSCCVDTDSVHAEASNRLNCNIERQAATDSRQSDSGNIYQSIDNVPVTYSLSTSPPPSQPVSPPETAAAAASYVVTDDVDFAATNRSSGHYDTIDDVLTASASSPAQRQSPAETDSVYLQPRRTVLSEPTPPSPAEPAAATGLYESIDEPHLDSSSVSPSTTSLPPQSPPETDNDYPHRTNLTNDVPCFYAGCLPTKPSDGAEPATTAASLYESMYEPHLDSSSALPSTSSQPTSPSPSRPEAKTDYIHPRKSSDDLPCFYQLEPNAKPTDADYYNCSQ